MQDNDYVSEKRIAIDHEGLGSDEYQNPVLEGADPFVLLHNGKYYLYSTNDKDGYRVFVSDDLVLWEDKGLCLKRGDVKGDKWFWAPEVLYRNGKFYMVYTAEEHLGIAVSNSPTGPFRQTEKRWISERNAIDGHFFVDDDGVVYLYYVRFDDGNVIYMNRMNENLLGFDESREKFLFRAEDEWELKDEKVVEGPFVIKHKDKYYLSYSANHTRSPYYAVGYAVSDSPSGPFLKFGGNPVLHRTEKVSGTGHHSFFYTKNGALACVYHRHYDTKTFRPRMVCIDKAGFEKTDGDDVLVIYGPTDMPQNAF